MTYHIVNLGEKQILRKKINAEKTKKKKRQKTAWKQLFEKSHPPSFKCTLIGK